MSSSNPLGEVILLPPDPNEVEISVFGPGYGECIVIHLGSGEWMVVDSCVRSGGKIPAALEYLEKLQVDAARSISTIVATHWHDDHVRGISRILEVADSARFYAAGVFRKEEFSALAKRRDVNSKFTSGIEELVSVVRINDERHTPLGLLSAVKRIRSRADSPVSSIWALSPSDADAARGLDHIATLLGVSSSSARRIPALDPNDISVVLVLETVAGAILLGGDLEHIPSDRSRGWFAVIDQGGRPDFKAGYYKVPHHGSQNADCDEIWDRLVNSDAVSVVTPWERSASPLPRQSDVDRLRTRTTNLFLTSDQRDVAQRRDRSVEKMIRESTRLFTPMRLRMGHVQARSKGDVWTVRGSEASVKLGQVS